MSDSNLMGIAAALVDTFNAGDANGFKACVTSDVVYDEVGTQRSSRGAGGWVRMWEQWRKALPDLQGKIVNAVVSGNTVIQELAWEGTHSGTLLLPAGSYPPTDRRMAMRAIQVLVFEGDKVKEGRHYFDALTLLQQIGAMPEQSHSAVAF
jgi:steroid delta-isomerase-like uncharacterized protein